MNRSALVIKMLHILYGRKEPVSREELAHLLECNIRNISEYKKELEIAGYEIESISGKYGGYLLKEESIFPALTLEEEEKTSIYEALNFLQKQSNFNYYPHFESAMNKLQARLKKGKRRETIYLEEGSKRLNENEGKMLENIYRAIENKNVIEIEYISNKNEISTRYINPYEVIINKDGYYVLAEDYTPKKTIGFKFFKITEERMKDVKVLTKNFYRREDFKVSDYIGKHTLLKQLQEAQLKISGISARLVNEIEIENTISKYFKENDLYIHFYMEGEYRLKQFILSLGKDCEVLYPISLKNKIIQELTQASEQYKKAL